MSRTESETAWISSIAGIIYERAQGFIFNEGIEDEVAASAQELGTINEGTGFTIRWHEKDQQPGWDYIKEGVSLGADDWAEAVMQARDLFEEFILKPARALIAEETKQS